MVKPSKPTPNNVSSSSTTSRDSFKIGSGMGMMGIAVVIVAMMISLIPPKQILNAIARLLWTTLGVTLGVGFGLGFALHVYEQLQKLQQQQEEEGEESTTTDSPQQSSTIASTLTRILLETIRPKSFPTTTTTSIPSTPLSSSLHYPILSKVAAQSNVLEDSSSYFAMMALAGYTVSDKVLRGQVLKSDSKFFQNRYPFTDAPIPEQCGPNLLQEDWPRLPKPVTKELGRFIEHVMRDYISGWYYKVDGGIIFIDERLKRSNGIERDGASSSSTSTTTTTTTSDNDSTSNTQHHPTNHHHRRMVMSTLTHRTIPFVDQIYRVLSVCFGSLATRAEHVNIFSLGLLKWTQAVAQTLKQYRHLRKIAQEKNETDHPTEIEIIREFLLAGKLHKAVTFGLDVPSLLFADAHGVECGTPMTTTATTDDDNGRTNTTTTAMNGNRPRDPNQVLEERLFGGPDMLKECELDYNRCLAFRLVRALLPKQESNSQVVMALVTEIFGACVLQPLMNLWIPSFLNEIIVNGTTSSEDKPETTTPTTTTTTSTTTTRTTSAGLSESTTGSNSGTSKPRTTSATQSPNVHPTSQPSRASSSDGPFNSTTDVPPGTTTTSSSPMVYPPPNVAGEDGSTAVAQQPSETNRKKPEFGPLFLKVLQSAISKVEELIPLDDCRVARKQGRQSDLVDYDDPDCQRAVIRLVLVLEAALLHGRCAFRGSGRRRKKMAKVEDETAEDSCNDEEEEEEEDEYEDEEDDNESRSFLQVLMELTSDMDAYEKRLYHLAQLKSQSLSEFDGSSSSSSYAGANVGVFVPDPNELSTIRTLVSTWFHTASLPRAMGLLIQSVDSILLPYYRDDAFLAVPKWTQELQNLIRVFEGVDIMVETMNTLASPRIDVEAEALGISKNDRNPKSPTGIGGGGGGLSNLSTVGGDMIAQSSYAGFSSTPRFLDFHKNAAFSASLRSERERRSRSWESQRGDDTLQTVHRRRASPCDVELHRELHALAMTFYNGTTMISIRDAARRADVTATTEKDSVTESEPGKVSLITVETVSNRRRIEVPDDDSSFLLRAQPRQLNPVSIHRDDRNHDLSYKCFLATYEEPTAFVSISARGNAGKFVRRVWIQYYPIDRTATVLLNNDAYARKLDRRKGKALRQDSSVSTVASSNTSGPFLSGAFLRERHLCQRPLKGTSSQSFLSNSVVESADFMATPRTGKALDFVYKMSLFEKPIIDLAGKQFTIHDSTARGHHRADASALEVSDASLSAILYGIGKEIGRDSSSSDLGDYKHKVEMGQDGYPIIFMKYSTSGTDETSIEIKPYRVSFVRAALMVTSARQEAQLQCLTDCIKAGSAKSATKAKTDTQLRPTLKILDYANDGSTDRLKESVLLRDLKLGVCHIDREQLRRNGLLNPRYPTEIRELSVTVEEAVPASSVPELFNSSIPSTTNLYRLRCIAVVELAEVVDDESDASAYMCEGENLAATYKEEWLIYRSIKDFQALHKQLKSEVAATESSISTGSRIVGVATAAFSSAPSERRSRKAMIPSLAQASKTGAIAVTQKAIARRGELLGEYMDYLLSPNHILSRCSEILLFIGALYPFPSEIKVTKTPLRLAGDPLGRTSFTRIGMSARVSPFRLSVGHASSQANGSGNQDRLNVLGRRGSDTAAVDENSGMIESILIKVDAVPLAAVRNRLVELVKFQFGFENASFLRSRLLSALETASFVAMTKNSNFRKFLYKTHIEQLNPEAIGGYIHKVLDILWPDGCWLISRPALTAEEEMYLMEASRQQLHKVFPEQIRAILGRELTRDGLDIVHEMLQNRMVVKSLFYTLFDLLWVEVFPELRDAIGSSGIELE